MNTRTPKFQAVREAYMASYSGRCIVHPAERAVALHEEPPRSLNPRWAEQPETWFPVCHRCHRRIQDMPREPALKLLEKARKEFPSYLLTNSFVLDTI